MTILEDIQAERERQDELKAEGKFKLTCADAEMSQLKRLSILAEEFGEVAKEVDVEEETGFTSLDLRTELVQLAAVCVAWVEFLDRERRPTIPAPAPPPPDPERRSLDETCQLCWQPPGQPCINVYAGKKRPVPWNHIK